MGGEDEGVHVKEGLMTEAWLAAPSSSGGAGVSGSIEQSPGCFLESQGIPGLVETPVSGRRGVMP